MKFSYDVIVVGAGHAGCEAAAASANLGSRTLLITMDMTKFAQMSCNPAIGGIAKGQIVREIDAMGGYTGIVSDKSALQFRMLNQSKGPAMWSPRSQNDKMLFSTEWRNILENIPNLYLWQDTVTNIIYENEECKGVKTALGVEIKAKTVILTNGTFLNGLMHVGRHKIRGGRMGDEASFGLSDQLKSLGISTGRMKTGTPVRIDGRTIDFSKLEEQQGEHDFHKFSYLPFAHRQIKQRNCFICFTNPEVHKILLSDLDESPMYNGTIKSIGPRYCPSIETKLVTFAGKDKHQLFLEPEGEKTHEFYLNGFSSSLPMETQIKALQKIEGFENVEIYRPGYAIEYDYFDPQELTHSLETRKIKNLFFAGQINGTTGYEEAAGQGLIAGINAHNKCHDLEPLILQRDQSYIGVLIDDLINKGVDEPYRMFTSRAEHRILLRQDDADMRLTEISYNMGLASKERYELMKKKKAIIEDLLDFCKTFSIKSKIINPALEKLGSTPLKQGCKLTDLIVRPQLTIKTLAPHIESLKEKLDAITDRKEEIIEATEIIIKYSGYIKREKGIAEKMQRLDNIRIADDFDYSKIQSLTIEARQKLSKIRPQTIGQASRISGVSPNDINTLLLILGR